jgi:hypothetical protein
MISESSGGGTPPVTKSAELVMSSSRSRYNRRGHKPRTNFSTNQNKFEGREPELKGHIYDKEIITFVGRKYEAYNMELIQGLEQLKLDDPKSPADPDPTNIVAFEKCKTTFKECKERIKQYTNFRSGLYSLVFGQCSDGLQDKLKSPP